METTPKPEFVTPEVTFAWTEYIFFGLTLAASLGIGIFYGFFGGKNRTNEEFLMAGRSMGMLPVTLSLLCSFVSAITLLGNPVEIYLYGVHYTMSIIGMIPMTLILMYLFVPVYFNLQLTSAYEYFEWRFSRKLRLTVSVMAIFHLMFYMPTTVYGPSLALDQVAGINTFLSCGAIFIVCIAYSSMGGLKAVLWTDALQAVVMVGSLIAVIVAGTIEVGGLSFMWQQSEITHRTDFYVDDPDPRSRHTIWADVIGGMFVWLPLFGATQAQIQRYNSVPKLSTARKTLLFNMFGLMTVVTLCSWVGLIMYAQYYDCDPISAGFVDSTDQMVPLFVIQVLAKYPGIPGLLVAGLTCGSLSSISSALNSLAALITEDFVKPRRPGMSEERLAMASKLISLITGIIAFVLVFIIAEVNKTVPIQPLSTLIHGTLLGPILGAFTLGIFFPWTEQLGVFMGIVTSILISGFVGVGGIFAGREGLLPDQRLTLRTDGCELATDPVRRILGLDQAEFEIIGREDWKIEAADDSVLIKIWSVSYMWGPITAVFTTIIVGLIVSGIVVTFRKEKRPKVNHSLLGKPLLKLWKTIFGQKYLDKWVDFHSPPHCGDPASKIARVINNNPEKVTEL